MKKKHSGGFLNAAPFAGALLVCVMLLGLMGCEDEPSLSGANKITGFTINGARGAIDEQNQRISLTLPAGTNLTALAPEITVSKSASVFPLSGEAADFSYPTSYTVTAENGSHLIYVVAVAAAPSVSLEYITVASTKTYYDYETDLDLDTLLVTGYYSDGSRQIETITLEDISGYDNTKVGEQIVVITLEGKIADFQVTVAADVALEGITVDSWKTNYDYGTDLDLDTLLVTGYYSDGSQQIEAITAENISGYDKTKAGNQRVVITLEGKIASFWVSVAEGAPLEISIGLPNNQAVPIFNIPEEGIILSEHENNGHPKEIVISAGKGYTDITWFYESHSLANDNIVTIEASDFPYKKHIITFTGSIDGVRYSAEIPFTVEY
jgi:hypothetical protein